MQTLHLRIDNFSSLPNGAPLSFVVSGKSAQVGRKTGMDWVLPDTSRHISGHHFDISYQGGRYYLTDVSANGTFIHGERYRLESSHEVQDGDRYTVGHYIISAQLEAGMAEGLQTPSAPVGMYDLPQDASHETPPSQHDLDDWDNLLPQQPNLNANIGGAMDDRQMPPGMHVPDAHLQSPQSLDPNSVADFQAPPISPPYPAEPPVQPPVDAMQPWAPQPAPTPAPAPQQMPPAHGAGQPPAMSPSPFESQQPVQPQPAPASMAPVPPAAPNPAAPQSGAADIFLQGFLEGAGLPPETQVNIAPHDLGRMLGQCVRMSTDELMKMLSDRAAVKMFFSKQERTMLNSSGNNPLKFMGDSNTAFSTMFLTPQDGYMRGPDGFANALADIRRHQASVVAALQPALAEMIEGLSPDDIEDSNSAGRLSNKSKKNWEEFVKRWDSKAAAGENGMLDVFIEAFSRHYADAMSKM